MRLYFLYIHVRGGKNDTLFPIYSDYRSLTLWLNVFGAVRSATHTYSQTKWRTYCCVCCVVVTRHSHAQTLNCRVAPYRPHIPSSNWTNVQQRIVKRMVGVGACVCFANVFTFKIVFYSSLNHDLNTYHVHSSSVGVRIYAGKEEENILIFRYIRIILIILESNSNF